MTSTIMKVEELDKLYTERAGIAVAFARMALSAGYDAGIGIDDKVDNDMEWRRVLYVDTPNGQVSWHIAPQDQHLLQGLPEYGKSWDGTFKGRDPSSYAVWPVVIEPKPRRSCRTIAKEFGVSETMIYLIVDFYKHNRDSSFNSELYDYSKQHSPEETKKLLAACKDYANDPL